jgi:hypothetical protein
MKLGGNLDLVLIFWEMRPSMWYAEMNRTQIWGKNLLFL